MWGQNGKSNFACLDCRYSASRARWAAGTPRCSSCGEPMEHMGVNFKAPRRRDAQQWEKIRRLVASDIRFHASCRCCQRGNRVEWSIKSLSDAKNQLRQRRSRRKDWSR